MHSVRCGMRPVATVRCTKADEPIASNWLSFLMVSTLHNGRQMYIVNRMTKFKLTTTENRDRRGCFTGTERGADCAYADALVG